MTRTDVLALIDEERDHQDSRWGTVAQHPHSVAEWLSIMRGYLDHADRAGNDPEALADVRKIAALAVACLEQHIPD